MHIPIGAIKATILQCHLMPKSNEYGKPALHIKAKLNFEFKCCQAASFSSDVEDMISAN